VLPRGTSGPDTHDQFRCGWTACNFGCRPLLAAQVRIPYTPRPPPPLPAGSLRRDGKFTRPGGSSSVPVIAARWSPSSSRTRTCASCTAMKRSLSGLVATSRRSPVSTSPASASTRDHVKRLPTTKRQASPETTHSHSWATIRIDVCCGWTGSCPKRKLGRQPVPPIPLRA